MFLLSILLIVLISIPVQPKIDTTYIVLDSNKPVEKQVVYNNASYVIKDSYMINKSFRLPKNCTLIFQGGKITGSGVLEGNTTYIEASPTKIFGDDLSVAGSWTMKNAYCEWFGGHVANDDNAIPFQKCIDAFNILTLNVGVYKIKRTINVTNDGCIISGVSRNHTEIQKLSPSKESINAIFNISNTRSKNIQYVTLRDLRLSSAGCNVDYGIYSDGINSSEFRNLTIFQCKNGFCCNNETHGSLWNLIFDNIEFNSNTIREFEGINNYGYPEQTTCALTCVTNGGAGLSFNHCWARDCAVGYHIKGVNYSIMDGCGADNIHGIAYLLEYSGISLTSCGMENVTTNSSIVLYHCNATITGFNDYKQIVKNDKETYRVKIDGGIITLINCHFSDWINKVKNSNIYGVTSNNGSKVLLINTKQPNHINNYMALKKGATFQIIE